MTTVYLYLTSQCDSMFTLVHCIGLDDDDDDVAEALATTCAVNTKLRTVNLIIPPLPVMKLLGTRQVPLEEFEILPPLVC